MKKKAKRTEHGPCYESHNPGKGCNSTHVARSRRKWKRCANRSERRSGVTSAKIGVSLKKRIRPEEEGDL